MMEPQELQRWEQNRDRELTRWREKTRSTGMLVECPLDAEGFWHRENCAIRMRQLKGAAGDASAEQRQVKNKLKQCQKCWREFSGN